MGSSMGQTMMMGGIGTAIGGMFMKSKGKKDTNFCCFVAFPLFLQESQKKSKVSEVFLPLIKNTVCSISQKQFRTSRENEMK